MIKILINGCNGKMGQTIFELINMEKNKNLEVIGGFDMVKLENSNFPVYTKINEISIIPDVIIDFSIPEGSLNILEYANKNNIPIVIATTGFSKEQDNLIKEYSKTLPIFKSANMSYDIMIMKKVVSLLAPLFKDTDIEIVETHHNKKIDSPSGTAQMLADSINTSLNNSLYCEYNRHDKREKRNKNEIGMSSIRGGNIVGEHSVQFFGDFETFEIKHISYSRNAFAEGSLKAAEFIVNQKTGLYCMEDMCDLNL